MTYRAAQRTSILAGVLAIALALPAVVFGQLSGHNLRGDYGLQSGSQLPPGYYGGMLYVNYDIDTIRDRNGDRLNRAGGDITLEGFAPFGMIVTEKQLWGANYGFLISPSWVNSSIDSPLLETELETGMGFSDLYVQPLHLGWHAKQADYVAGLGMFMPTGSYDEGADDNVGLGMWSFEAFGGVTYFFDKEKTWHVSTLASYETHTEKEGSDQRVGDLLTLEGGVGKLFMQGAINIGCAYAAQWKVTDDDLDNPPLDRIADRHQLFLAGPELTIPVFATEKTVGLLNARYLWDFGAESTTEGDSVVITFLVSSL